MAKLKAKIAESSEELHVVGKKAKKRQARAAAKAAAKVAKAQAKAEAQAREDARQEPEAPAQEPAPPQPEGAMSRCALLCQEQRWREAALLCRRMSTQAQEEGKVELAASLQGAQKKIEYSLRRQMAAAYINAARDFLKKEYLLDVG